MNDVNATLDRDVVIIMYSILLTTHYYYITYVCNIHSVTKWDIFVGNSNSVKRYF